MVNESLWGDFNLTLDKELDRLTSRTRICNNDAAMNMVKLFMEETMLTDVWRVRNPDKRVFSWSQRRPYVASRIDLLLIDQAYTGWVNKIEIRPGYRSDHSMIFCEIHINQVKRGQGKWKLNENILSETEYVSAVNEMIDNSYLKARELLEDEQWDVLKLEIINYSKKYAKARAENKKVIISQLEQALTKLQNSHDKASLKLKSKTQK